MHYRVAYALPVVAVYYLIYPVWAILPGIYAKYFGLSLASVAMAVLVARLFDAVTDPLVGYLSDRFYGPGTRKPWVLVGCIALIVSGYFLYVPPEVVSPHYFTVCLVVFTLAWSMIEIPHLAWGGELADSAEKKSKVYTARAVAVFIGSLLASSIPWVAGEVFSPTVIKGAVFISAALMVPMLYLCLTKTPQGRGREVVKKPEKSGSTLRVIINNAPLALLLAAYCLSQTGYGMALSMGHIFADSYLNVGKSLPLIYTLCSVVGVMSLLLIYRLPERWEKKWLWSIGELLKALTFAGTALISPGENAVVVVTVVWAISLVGFSLSAVYVPSLLSDISEYGALKFGANHSALYFSCYQFMLKFSMGIGGSIGFAVAAWYGYDPAMSYHSDSSLVGLKVSVAYLPGLLILLSVPFIAAIPISAHRQRIIKMQIEHRNKYVTTVECFKAEQVSEPQVVIMSKL